MKQATAGDRSVSANTLTTAVKEAFDGLDAPSGIAARRLPEFMQSWTEQQKQALSGKQIVFVDDDPVLLELYTSLLEMTGAHPRSLHYGGGTAEALAVQIRDLRRIVEALLGRE